MAYENSNEKERFTFYKTRTDDISKTNHKRPYDYKGKPF
jgi:hypothetical protein